jgi:hypothetical protein
MDLRHCHRLILSAAIVLAALCITPKAQAHTGPHMAGQGTERPAAGTKARPVELHAQPAVASPADPLSQCGGQLCCGSACPSGAYVMSGDSLVLTPAMFVTIVFPADGPSQSGIPGEGVRRPPRA